MSVEPFSRFIVALGGLIGLITSGLAVLAYQELKGSNYCRLLLPILIATMVFTLSHALLYFSPQDPLIVYALEPLALTVVAVGVFRLIILHPDIAAIRRGDRR